jgi:hypothetical protein
MGTQLLAEPSAFQCRPNYADSGEPFKFTVIAVLPDCWEVNFEEVGIALCRTLTEEPDRLSRVLSGFESAVLDEFVGRQERNEPLNPADLSESIVAAISGMLREAFSMSRAFAAVLVERQPACTHLHEIMQPARESNEPRFRRLSLSGFDTGGFDLAHIELG